MSLEIPEEQTQAAVEAIAMEVLSEGGVFAPPTDAIALAAELNMTVARDGVSNTRARFVRLADALGSGRGAILLSEEPRPERRHWAVAHEIGECFAYRVFESLGLSPIDAPPAARETVANRIAGCLMLPREWFLADGVDLDWDLFELKSRYSTASHELLARRMLEMPAPVIITLADQGRCVWRRSNRYFCAPPITHAETDVWRVAHVRGGPAECETRELPDGIVDVRVWPVHEPQWKREIVRTALIDE